MRWPRLWIRALRGHERVSDQSLATEASLSKGGLRGVVEYDHGEHMLDVRSCHPWITVIETANGTAIDGFQLFQYSKIRDRLRAIHIST